MEKVIMVHTLTEEESNNYQHKLSIEVDNWWASLSLKDKESIFKYHKDMFEYIKCSHEFRPISFYSSKMEHCDKCGYSRSVQEIRDEKIKKILK